MYYTIVMKKIEISLKKYEKDGHVARQYRNRGVRFNGSPNRSRVSTTCLESDICLLNRHFFKSIREFTIT